MNHPSNAMGKYIFRIGLVDFHNPTLLLIGKPASFNWLAERVESRQPLDFATVPFVKQESMNLLLAPTESAGTLIREGKNFFWKVSLSESQNFSELLRSLSVSGGSHHQYLDPAINTIGVEIVASTEEYDDLVFPQWHTVGGRVKFS